MPPKATRVPKKAPATKPAAKKKAPTSEEAVAQVEALGYYIVYTFKDQPGYHYVAHTHSDKTAHLIVSGSLEYCYPDDGPERHVCGPGDLWEVEAHKRHEVWIGKEGATYVIGE